MKKFDVLCVGNATRDVFIDLGIGHGSKETVCFFCGSKNEIKEIDIQTGGGAINTAFSYSTLGLKTSVLIGVGRDEIGEKILSELKEKGVDVSLAVTEKSFRSAYSAIVTGHGGDCVIFSYGGATAHLNANHIKWDKLSADWAHITSFHSKHSILKKIVFHLAKNGTRIVFNPGKKELSLGLKELSFILKKCFVLCLNKEEAMLLSGETDMEKAARKLHAFTPVIVITLSSKGAMAFDGSDFFYVKPFKVKVVDVTGAGDAFNSAFTAALIKGESIETALKWGSAQAASVLTMLGAKQKLLTERGLKRFIRTHSFLC